MCFDLLIAVSVDGQWRMGIGDPTWIGWITVGCYIAAAFLCGAVGCRVPEGRRFWLVLSGLFLLLGLNKQLDLQTALTQWGRSLALNQGWYEQRRRVQVSFVLLVALSGGVFGAACLWFGRSFGHSSWLVRLGVVFVVCFVIIRAASFHHVDTFLSRSVLGLPNNAAIELFGLACVVTGCTTTLRRHGQAVVHAS